MSNLLIVDDEQSYRQLLSLVFESEGHSVRTAMNGREALEILQQQFAELIISDVRMPDMDGITAVKEIRKIDPAAMIIMCSAMGQQAMVIDAIQAGAKDFVVKPFQPERVLEAVRKVLA